MKQNRLIRFFALAVVLGATVSLQSCTKALQNLHFNLGMQTQTETVTIPVTPSGTLSVGPVTTTYNVDSFIKASTGNQLGINNIYSVKLASVVLTIVNPDSTNNFANFQSCSASMSSNTNSTPYTLNISNNPDTYAPSLSLPVDANMELKSYIGTQFNYNVTGVLRHPVTKPLTCTITFSYNLVVQG